MDGIEQPEDDPVYRIVGCAMTVLNSLGHGLREKTYERALRVELESQGIPVQTQTRYPVYYRGQHIDDYIPDMEVMGSVIVEVKTVERDGDEQIGQVLNYLRISGLEKGVVLNFRHPKLEWKRLILQNGRVAEER